MGPLAAAFFSHGSAGVGSLFKTVFANWIDALISVSLWKFWWCVVILVMQTRIEWLQEQGIYIPNSQWEDGCVYSIYGDFCLMFHSCRSTTSQVRWSQRFFKKQKTSIRRQSKEQEVARVKEVLVATSEAEYRTLMPMSNATMQTDCGVPRVL